MTFFFWGHFNTGSISEVRHRLHCCCSLPICLLQPLRLFCMYFSWTSWSLGFQDKKERNKIPTSLLYRLPPQPPHNSKRRGGRYEKKTKGHMAKISLMPDSRCFENGKNCLPHLSTEAALIRSYVIVAHKTLIKYLVYELRY